jgi:hypothetical protein
MYTQSREKYSQAAVRDVTCAAWALLNLAPQNVSMAQEMLTLVFQHQLPDGAWPWTFNETTNVDPNSVQFTSMCLARIFLTYKSLFPAVWFEEIRVNISNAAIASRNQNVAVSYTNIYTMRLINQFMYGQLLPSPGALRAGLVALANWTELVYGAGLHEFDSPTYTAVTYDNLASGIEALSNASIVTYLTSYLDYVAMDLVGGLMPLQLCVILLVLFQAANYFAPSDVMAGSHSRDYDFMFGNEGDDHVYLLNGWSSFPTESADDITDVSIYIDYLRGGYMIPASIAALRDLSVGPREVRCLVCRADDVDALADAGLANMAAQYPIRLAWK